MKTQEKSDSIAISGSDFEKFGCPHCGGIFGTVRISGHGSALWDCSCGNGCVILSDGITQSSISLGNSPPLKLQEHPRKDKPIDREQLILERKNSIKEEELADLKQWLRLGYGKDVVIKEVGSHTSKSRKLPILATAVDGGVRSSNVEVNWFGQNYYSYFLGLAFEKSINAMLLHPISSVFGEYPLSGHVNTKIAPPLVNFQLDYLTQKPLSGFGAECPDGFVSAQVIRYLALVSELDVDEIMSVCLGQNRHGGIDANRIDLMKIVEAVGLSAEECSSSYDFLAKVNHDGIFREIKIDRFNRAFGKSAVKVSLKSGRILPQMPSGSGERMIVCVDPVSTAIGMRLVDWVDNKPEKCLEQVPAHLLEYRSKRPEEIARLEECGYPAHNCYATVSAGTAKHNSTTEFTFHVPNVLDAAMLTLFLTKVLDPIVKDYVEGSKE